MGSVLNSAGGFIDNTLGTNMTGQNANALAAQRQEEGTQNAINTLDPWRAIGQGAFSAISNGVGYGYNQSPGYQAQLKAGQTAINNSLASRGLANSGAALKALTGYSQDLADQDYQKYYDNEFARLSLLAGYGNNAANNIASAQSGLGNALAASEIGRGNQTTNFFNQGLELAGSLFNKKGGG